MLAKNAGQSAKLVSSAAIAALGTNNTRMLAATAPRQACLFQKHDLLATTSAPFVMQRAFLSNLPVNTIIKFVPQQEAWIVERMGRFSRVLEPGLNFLMPIIDQVKYVQSLKEIAIEIPKQSAITKDNVAVSIDGVLYLRVMDAYKASYGVEDPEFAITQLAQTTMRSEIGKISMDIVFREREILNQQIVDAVNKASEVWGITCLRYEIRDIKLPQRIQEAMQMQVEAERKKRAAVLESEGVRDAQINVAEGTKRARILASEAERMEQMNVAEGDAAAIQRRAEARAAALGRIAESIGGPSGADAAAFEVAEKYVRAFSQLAKETNTLIVPSAAGDVSAMVAQSLAIYKNLSSMGAGKKNHNAVSHANDAGSDNSSRVQQAPKWNSTSFGNSGQEARLTYADPPGAIAAVTDAATTRVNVFSASLSEAARKVSSPRDATDASGFHSISGGGGGGDDADSGSSDKPSLAPRNTRRRTSTGAGEDKDENEFDRQYFGGKSGGSDRR